MVVGAITAQLTCSREAGCNDMMILDVLVLAVKKGHERMGIGTQLVKQALSVLWDVASVGMDVTIVTQAVDDEGVLKFWAACGLRRREVGELITLVLNAWSPTRHALHNHAVALSADVREAKEDCRREQPGIGEDIPRSRGQGRGSSEDEPAQRQADERPSEIRTTGGAGPTSSVLQGDTIDGVGPDAGSQRDKIRPQPPWTRLALEHGQRGRRTHNLAARRGAHQEEPQKDTGAKKQHREAIWAWNAQRLYAASTTSAATRKRLVVEEAIAADPEIVAVVLSEIKPYQEGSHYSDSANRGCGRG